MHYAGGSLRARGTLFASHTHPSYLSPLPPSPPSPSLPISRCEDGTTVIPWAAPTRAAQLSRLEKEEFDLVVIGGGCVGAGVAWEASTRGLKVALVERDDFAAGTSGRSTKLIHGGIRYLESAVKNLDPGMYHLVSEALAERAHLLHAAPYMARPLATLIPLYTWWEIPYMYIGAKVYDLIAGSRRAVPEAYYISRDEALYQFPLLNGEGLKGGIVYYDGMHNDTRMNLMIALTAAQNGAALANYLEVTTILKDEAGRASGVRVRDVQGGSGGGGREITIRAKGVVNATGCFGDAIRKMDDPKAENLILGAAGVHIVLPDHFSPDNMGLIVPKTKDGRVLFFLPWEGSTICGTTDSPSDITMTPKATEEDISFIIEESQRFLTRKVRLGLGGGVWGGDQIAGPHFSHPSPPPSLHISRFADPPRGRQVRVERHPPADPRPEEARRARRQVVAAVAVARGGRQPERYGVHPGRQVDHLPPHGGGGHRRLQGRARQEPRHHRDRALQDPPHAGASLLVLLGKEGRWVVPPLTFSSIRLPHPFPPFQVLGADRAGIVINQKYDRIPVTLREVYGFSKDVAKHLTVNYGTRALQVAELAKDKPALARRLNPSYPFLAAEVVFACEQEYALTAVDVLARRTRLAFLNADAAAAAVPDVVELMGGVHGWGRARKEAETKAALEFLTTMR